jgi:HEAT repeat protein
MRRLAAHALGEIGPAADAAAIPALLRATEDEAVFVRVWAAAALARVSPHHHRVLPTLEAAMRHEAAFVRSLAAWHLGRVGAGLPGLETALARLKALEGDPDPSVRAEAAVALKLLRSDPVRQRG